MTQTMNDTARVAVDELIRTRRATRDFDGRPVDPDLLDWVVEMALEAPSSYNMQNRDVVVVTDRVVRERLCAAAFGQRQVREAPAVLVFCARTDAVPADLDEMVETGRRNGAWPDAYADGLPDEIRSFQGGLVRAELVREYAVKDAMIAASFAMVAAQAAGLRSAPMNGWSAREVESAVGIREGGGRVVALMLPLGHPVDGDSRAAHPGRDREGRLVRERYPAA